MGGLQVGERASSRAKVAASFFDTSTFHPHPKNPLRGSPTNVPKKGRAAILPPLPQFPHSAPPRPVLISLSFSFPCTTFLLSFLLFPLENPGNPPRAAPRKKTEIGENEVNPHAKGLSAILPSPTSHPQERHETKAPFHLFITNFAPQGPQKGTKFAFLCFRHPPKFYVQNPRVQKAPVAIPGFVVTGWIHVPFPCWECRAARAAPRVTKLGWN